MKQIVCVNLVTINGQCGCLLPGEKPHKCRVRADIKTCCKCDYLRSAHQHRCRPCKSALAAVRGGYQVIGQIQQQQPASTTCCATGESA